MKHRFLMSLVLLASPLLVSAADLQIDVNGLRIQAPGVTLTFGSRDNRGYYWDGEQYRDSKYWREHNGQKGEKYYTGRSNNGVPNQGGGFCPPGQAKKGNC
jgi:hypothetical protein